MPTNLQNIKSNYAQILIPIIGILIIISWLFLIVPDLKNDFSAFEIHEERNGEKAFVENIGDPLPIPEQIRLTLTHRVTGSDGNILEIISIFRDFDIFTGEITWESDETFYVDKATRKHVGDKEGYFLFPHNTQKQDYVLHHPLVVASATFFYEGTEFIDDLEVYIFSCNSLDTDITSSFPQFAPEIIHSDNTCLAKIEPITGEVVYTRVTWDNYVIQDGLRIPISVGNSETTEYTQDIRVKTVKDRKELFQFYDSIVPTFMLVTLGGAFITSLYDKKLKTKGRIIIKQFEELKKADKTKTLFLNNLTHELKTPLVPIRGYCEMLQQPDVLGKLNDEQLDAVNEIDKHSSALLRTADNFLKLQQITENKLSLKIQKVNVDELKEIISKISLGKSKKKFKLETTFDKELSVNADKSELIAILTELIQNTTDFLPEQGGKIEIGAKEQNGNVLFSVKDNGIGISKEKLTEIFKPFIKADMSQSRTHNGVGLGLAMCKGLVEAMKGKIWVESIEDNGATFFFTIPKAD